MSKNDKSLIKKAEQNVLNHAMFIQDILTVVEQMTYNVGSFSSRNAYRKQDDIAEGLNLLHQGLYKELMYTIGDAFALVGVGGEEAAKYSKERAKQVFGGKYEIVHLLDKHLRVPSHWLSEEVDQFDAELKEALGDE